MFNKRKSARDKRKSLDSQIHSEYSKEICRKIQNFITDKNVIMIYNAIDGEVDVSFLLNDKKTFLYPLVVEENIIAVKSNEFKVGSYGIKEPIGSEYCGQIDAVIVPMCAFDNRFNRLGFGKGYYDRFLKNKDTLKIGAAFSCQQVDSIEVKKTDVKMDVIITEKDILEK